MDGYLERIKNADAYIKAAGIEFDQFRLAKIFSGLNFKRYEILRLIPKDDRSIVIVQRSKGGEGLHWCVQYRGGGKYFSTWEGARDYYFNRFRDHALDAMDGTEESIDSRLEAQEAKSA